MRAEVIVTEPDKFAQVDKIDATGLWGSRDHRGNDYFDGNLLMVIKRGDRRFWTQTVTGTMSGTEYREEYGFILKCVSDEEA